MTVGRGLSPDRRVAAGSTPVALIVILALTCTEPTAPTEALPIGTATHMPAGDTFADCLPFDFKDHDLREPLVNRKPAQDEGRGALPAMPRYLLTKPKSSLDQTTSWEA